MGRDHIREYLSYCRVEKGLSANSIEGYGRDLEKLSSWVNDHGLEIAALTREDLREWMRDLGRTKLSQSSKQRILSSLRGFYRFLMTDGHLKTNPAENLDTPQKGSYLPRFLNQAEIEILLAAPDTSTETGVRDRAILELMYACGLRVSEAANIKRTDIDLETGILTCVGKGSKTRRVPVGSSAIEWIRQYLAVRAKNETPLTEELFTTPLGKTLNRQSIFKLVKENAEKCGLTGVSPHTLRHSFATHLVQNSADIRSVQMMLGHADISATQIYTHMTDEHLRKSYEKFHPRAKNT